MCVTHTGYTKMYITQLVSEHLRNQYSHSGEQSWIKCSKFVLELCLLGSVFSWTEIYKSLSNSRVWALISSDSKWNNESPWVNLLAILQQDTEWAFSLSFAPLSQIFSNFSLTSLVQAFYFSLLLCFWFWRLRKEDAEECRKGFFDCLCGLGFCFTLAFRWGKFPCFRVSSPQIFSGGAQGTFQDGFLPGLSSSAIMVDFIFWVLTAGQQETGTLCSYNFWADQSPHGSNSHCLSQQGNSLTHPSCILRLLCKWKAQFSSVQSLSRVQLFATSWTTACQASLSITNTRSPPKPMFIESVMPSNHLILCHPLLFLPSILPSIRVSSNESALRIRWLKYQSFSFSISPSNGHPGLISLRMDWLDLLAVQGTLKSLLQHHSSKASILLHSALFIVKLSHPHMTIRKTKALTSQTFVDKVMSLLFNMLSELVITFLPTNKRLLISWLQSPSAVILEPPKIKSGTVSTVSPSVSMKWWDQMPLS